MGLACDGEYWRFQVFGLQHAGIDRKETRSLRYLWLWCGYI